MIAKLFIKTFRISEKYRKQLLIACAIITTIAILGLISIKMDNDVALMLPNNPQLNKSLKFLRESELSGKIIISLNIQTKQKSPQTQLIKQIDKLTPKLKHKYISKTISKLPNITLEDTLLYLNYTPQLTNKKELQTIKKQINDKYINQQMKQNYQILASPTAIFMKKLIINDPLRWKQKHLKKLNQLSKSLNYKINLTNGYFISNDQHHAMIILQTNISPTDSNRSKQLITHIKKALSTLPQNITANLICGHLHTISNEKIIKHDVRTMIIISTIAFILLFAGIFRDWRATIVLLIPLSAIVLAIHLSNIIQGHFSYFIAGLGGITAGIAIDYAIHIYMALDSDTDNATNLKHIGGPVMIGALTTCGVFASFIFASTAGYRQFALFALISITICLIYSFYILPHILLIGRKFHPFHNIRQFIPHKHTINPTILKKIWLAFIIITLILSSRNKIITHMNSLDGSEKQIFQNEKQFNKIWSNNNLPAICILEGKNLEQLYQQYQQLNIQAQTKIGEINYHALTDIWPARKQRIQNLEHWQTFWTNKQCQNLKQKINNAGAKYGFKSTAFSNFITQLQNQPPVLDFPIKSQLFNTIKEQFYNQSPNHTIRLLAYFPDQPQYITRLSKIIQQYPSAYIVSRHKISQTLSKTVSHELTTLTILSAILIPLLAFFLLRNLSLTILALLPVISGISAIGSITYLCGMSINAPAMIASMIVIGLNIDYGIFSIYSCKNKMCPKIKTGITLSALTTLAGSIALLFAKHPVMHIIGITLTTGVLTGYLTAIYIIPAFYQKTTQKSLLTILLIIPIFLNSCISQPFPKPQYKTIPQTTNPKTTIKNFQFQLPQQSLLVNSILFKYRFHTFSSLGMTKLNYQTNHLIAVGLNPAGIKLFQIEQKAGKTTCQFKIKPLQKIPNFAQTIATDIYNTYFQRIPTSNSIYTIKKDRIIAQHPYQQGKLIYTFAGENNYLIQKEYKEKNKTIYKINYYQYKKEKQTLHPIGIILTNKKYHYKLIITLKQILPKNN